MRHIPPLSSPLTMSKRRQRLLSLGIGVVLALGQLAFVYLVLRYFRVNDIPTLLGRISDIPTLIGPWALIAFVATIPPSFSIARATRKRSEGMEAGKRTGCTAALLTMLVAVGALLLFLTLNSELMPVLAGMIIGLLLMGSITLIGTAAAFAGAFVGSRLGAPPPV